MVMLNSDKPRIAIIGAGAGGIGMAITLLKRYKYTNFVIFEKAADVGGTWRENTYPGCQCDVPSNIYSLSSELNPNWSTFFAYQPEILKYWDNIAQKYDLIPRIQFNALVKESVWDVNTQAYQITVQDTVNAVEQTHTFEVIISAVGGLHWPYIPKDLKGADEFTGQAFHTSEYPHDLDLRRKRVGVIGNGASGVQLVPAISEDPSVEVFHFCRSSMWVAPRPDNTPYSSFAKWIFANVPSVQRAYRLIQLSVTDFRYLMFWKENKLILYIVRKVLERYMLKAAPKQYHQYLIPDFPVGCRRVILDPGYLKSLHRPNVVANWDGIESIIPEGIKTKKDEIIPLDIIIYATGFLVGHLSVKVTGRTGLPLDEYFESQGGPTGYMGTMMPGFPNLFTIPGANATTVHGSALFSEERQMHYIAGLLEPIIKGEARAIEPTGSATDEHNKWLQDRFKQSIFLDCTSYYRHGYTGKNYTSFPGSFLELYWMTRKPNWNHFIVSKGAQ